MVNAKHAHDCDTRRQDSETVNGRIADKEQKIFGTRRKTVDTPVIRELPVASEQHLVRPVSDRPSESYWHEIVSTCQRIAASRQQTRIEGRRQQNRWLKTDGNRGQQVTCITHQTIGDGKQRHQIRDRREELGGSSKSCIKSLTLSAFADSGKDGSHGRCCALPILISVKFYDDTHKQASSIVLHMPQCQ
jgi:hypothetical protein